MVHAERSDNSETVAKAVRSWVRMMAPVTPHIAEELWEGLGEKGFVSIAPFPEEEELPSDPMTEASENYLQEVMADINEILKLTGIVPKRIINYTAPQRKSDILSQTGPRRVQAAERSRADEGRNVPRRPQAEGKDSADFARKTAEDLMKRSSRS